MQMDGLHLFCFVLPCLVLLNLGVCVWELIFSILLFFSCSVLSDSLGPHGLQHARLPCPSLSPGVRSNHVY